MRTLIALPALVAALATAIPAQAAVEPIVKHKTVRFHDLDLSRPADRKKLEFRVRKAARVVCGGLNIRNVPAISQDSACYDRAIAGARQHLAARGIDLQLAGL